MAANKQTSKSHQNSGTLGGGLDEGGGEDPSVRPRSHLQLGDRETTVFVFAFSIMKMRLLFAKTNQWKQPWRENYDVFLISSVRDINIYFKKDISHPKN